ncbi:MAG: SusC/RagA family TonB-linked outer membrane protein [Bacteroidales bacterium]
MRNKIIGLVLIFFAFIGSVSAQSKITGRILSPSNDPVSGAVVSATGAESVVTSASDGSFEIKTDATNVELSISAEGFYEYKTLTHGDDDFTIVLMNLDRPKYNNEVVLPYRNTNNGSKTSLATNLAMKDLDQAITLEAGLQAEVAGLRVTNKSGVPGEGAYLNIRGIRSLNSTNKPLILVNGVPYITDDEESPVISAYSKGTLAGIDVTNIKNVTVLTGAEATIYGSMGANGVILIETNGAKKSDVLDTKFTLRSQFGVNWNNKQIPLMNSEQYKSYVSDIGLTRYDDMADLISAYPFIQDESYNQDYLYTHDTNWQEEIYSPAFVTSNSLRIEGGDAIALYDISLGLLNEGGVIDNTGRTRFNTQINARTNITRKLEFLTNIALAFTESGVQEQGMTMQANPLLVALNKQPILSPWAMDIDGKTLSTYDVYRYDLSNPMAIVNTVNTRARQHILNARLGLNYTFNEQWKLEGRVGMHYNYDQQQIFIPGITDKAITPNKDVNYGTVVGENTVRSGSGKMLNMYYNLNAIYSKALTNGDRINAYGGFQAMTNTKEYDAGVGYNTASDYYQTLDKVQDVNNVDFYGYSDDWNWLNFYAHGDYTWNNLVRGSVNAAVDGSSSIGKETNRFSFYPSAAVTLLAKNLGIFKKSVVINRLDVNVEYGLTGNSRFSPDYGKDYYTSTPFLTLSAISRSSIPNTGVNAERVSDFNIGMETSLLRNRVNVGLAYYHEVANNALVAESNQSVFGVSRYFNNSGEIKNSGIEASLAVALLSNKDIEWIVGGNIATLNNEIVSMGANTSEVIDLAINGDDAQLINKEGYSPYNFYGLKANGVIASKEEAEKLNLKNALGVKYQAGDVHYEDVKADGVINDEDKQLLGAALPDFFGGFFTSIRYKNLTVAAEFTYSQGNEAYNAVRRNIESTGSMNNRSLSVVNRWQLDGQETDVPRAVYDDPVGNDAFSSRWIEDASYMKLKHLTISYNINKEFLRIFKSGIFYVTGENLFAFTNYLGLDPEFSYSYSDALQGVDYGKIVLPRSVRFGFNLNF